MKIIAVSLFILAFILFRPYQLQNSGMIYSGDDDSYMAHATSLVFFQFPFYSKEYFTMGKDMPLHSIGASLLACPFVFFASMVDRISGNKIIIKRTASNVFKSWAAFGFTLASVFYLWTTCLLLYKSLTLYFKPQIASLTVILTVLLQGVPLFVFRRPVFSHIYEIFLQSLFIFLMLRQIKFNNYMISGKRFGDSGDAIFVGLLIGLISLVRINNVFISLTWPIILFSVYHPKIGAFGVMKKIVISYLTMLVLILIFEICPIFANLQVGYQYEGYFSQELLKDRLLVLHNPIFFLKRISRLLWGFNWGLIFTAPYLVIGLFSLILIKKDKVFAYLVWPLLPIAVNLYVVLIFCDQGSWYGYRFLFFSLIPIIIYPMARLLLLAKEKDRIFYYAIILVGILPALSMLSFESNNTNLTLKVIDQGFGKIGWGNLTYQAEIYKTILSSPIRYLIGILKGGPLYFIYIVSVLFKCERFLPLAILEKYTIFQPAVFIKTMIIYAFPFVLLLGYEEIKKNRKEIFK